MSNNRTHFVKHLNRKTVCPPIVADVDLDVMRNYYCQGKIKAHRCDVCDKQFTSKNGLVYHKNNVCMGASTSKPTTNELLELQSTVQQLTDEIAKLRSTSTQPVINITNKSNGDANINVHIVTNNYDLRDFGNENVSHVTEDVSRKFFERGVFGILDMIHYVFFNDDVPENHNVRLKSLKNMLVEVFKNPNWIIQDLKSTVKRMIENSHKHIVNNMDYMDIVHSIDKMYIYNSMSNIEPSTIKEFRDRVKAQLVQRRQTHKSGITP
jgi:hypothetical protein